MSFCCLLIFHGRKSRKLVILIIFSLHICALYCTTTVWDFYSNCYQFNKCPFSQPPDFLLFLECCYSCQVFIHAYQSQSNLCIGKPSADLVNKTAVVGGICNFGVIQTDIAHIVAEKGTTPVIVLFKRKADRTNLYRQE